MEIKIIGPKINSYLEEIEFEKIKTEEDVSGCCFKNEIITFDNNNYMEISGCVFQNCRFVNFNPSLHLTDVVFETCGLSNMKLDDGSLTRVSFKECRISGQIVDTFLENISFSDCLMNYMNMSNCKIKNVIFRNCELKESSFSLEYKNLYFKKCNLENSEFQDMDMKDIDLSCSNITGIALNPRKIKGLIVNSEQALAMALMLGIVIKD